MLQRRPHKYPNDVARRLWGDQWHTTDKESRLAFSKEVVNELYRVADSTPGNVLSMSDTLMNSFVNFVNGRLPRPRPDSSDDESDSPLAKRLQGTKAADARKTAQAAARKAPERTRTRIVPTSILNDFVASEFAAALSTRWETYAYDILPQYEGVINGDWEEAGYSIEREFPILVVLAERFGNAWKAYLDSQDDIRPSTTWVVSDMIDEDDFDELLGANLEDWRALDNIDKVQAAIAEFQNTIFELVSKDDDGDE